jgi:hypothetical protein
VATVLQALGGVLWGQFAASPPPVFQVDLRHLVLYSAVFGSLIQIAVWGGWVAITWFWLRYILYVEDVQWQRLVRTMGFAFAPMGVQLLLVFPVLEFPVGLFAVGATIAGSVLAVRAASGASPGQAVFATLMGAFLFVLVLGVLGNSDTDLAPGIFALDPNAISVRLELRSAGP